MANSYVKIWTTILSDEKFLALTGNQRAVYLQLIMEAKIQSDSGHVHFKSYSQAAQVFGGDDSTITRALLKLHSSGLITMKRESSGVISVFLPNYIHWQTVTPQEVITQKRQKSSRMTQNPPLPDQTRPDQTRPKQTNSDSKESVEKVSLNKEIILYFAERYKQTYGEEYLIKWAKDGKAVKFLLDQKRTVEEIKKKIELAFKSNDEWIKSQNREITGFVFQCWNRIVTPPKRDYSRPPGAEI